MSVLNCLHSIREPPLLLLVIRCHSVSYHSSLYSTYAVPSWAWKSSSPVDRNAKAVLHISSNQSRSRGPRDVEVVSKLVTFQHFGLSGIREDAGPRGEQELVRTGAREQEVCKGFVVASAKRVAWRPALMSIVCEYAVKDWSIRIAWRHMTQAYKSKSTPVPPEEFLKKFLQDQTSHLSAAPFL